MSFLGRLNEWLTNAILSNQDVSFESDGTGQAPEQGMKEMP